METQKDTRRLVTSALPYVNNVPHLGNLIQMLSADVFARFCRSRGYETLYICGTDEYGTATETRAAEEKMTPRELCDYYYKQHEEIYEWFEIAFDKFGRTSNEQCTQITQSFFSDLDKNGYIKEHSNKQLYCPKCAMFLADRYVHGVCPKCGFEDARGDQCEKCGTLLDPVDLVRPRCAVCSSTPAVRQTQHLYIDLPAISGKLEKWMEKTAVEGRWADNAVATTKAWIRDGLNERAITRDLKWGIPVPKAGYEQKVFYVWFNAPIGYISITKQLADELAKTGKPSFDWKSWWIPSESDEAQDKPPVKLFQFIGKDNIPFHTVIFPSSQIGSGREYTKLFHMSSSEYLNYEDGKFSKSRGVGVFGTDARESGIKADAWRFYIFYNRPEKQDYQFTWREFREKYNGELIGNLGNFINRTLSFVQKYYEGKIPDGQMDEALWDEVDKREKKVTDLLEWAEIRDAFREIFLISDIGNKAFQQGEPWKTRITEPSKAATLIFNLCYLVKDLVIMAHPFLPHFCETVVSWLGKKISEPKLLEQKGKGLDWGDLGKTQGLCSVVGTQIYFTPLDQRSADAFRQKFSGTQSERHEDKNVPKKLSEQEQQQWFCDKIDLKVAVVTSVAENPQSDKLFIETLDDGTGQPRTIQSGLRGIVPKEELLGKHIILVANLEPRKMRGVESRGMLLAADYTTQDGSEHTEVLEAPWAVPGTQVTIEGVEGSVEKPKRIKADDFFAVQIKVSGGKVQAANKSLVAAGRPIETAKARDGDVH